MLPYPRQVQYPVLASMDLVCVVLHPSVSVIPQPSVCSSGAVVTSRAPRVALLCSSLCRLSNDTTFRIQRIIVRRVP